MKFDNITCKSETVSTYDYKVYGDFVLISITFDRTSLSYLANDPIHLAKSKNGIEFCITKKMFDENVECFGTDPDWISYGHDQCVEYPVNKEYLEKYIDGELFIDFPFESEDSVRTVLENGEFYRLLVNKENGFLYNLFGEPVWKKLPYHDIFSLSKLDMGIINYLEQCNNVSSIKYHTVDDDILGTELHLDFIFTPTQEEFNRLEKEGEAYCLEPFISDILNLKQFMKGEIDEFLYSPR